MALGLIGVKQRVGLLPDIQKSLNHTWIRSATIGIDTIRNSTFESPTTSRQAIRSKTPIRKSHTPQITIFLKNVNYFLFLTMDRDPFRGIELLEEEN
jgi:hypothetical protein